MDAKRCKYINRGKIRQAVGVNKHPAVDDAERLLAIVMRNGEKANIKQAIVN
jgi:hypothetical protein